MLNLILGLKSVLYWALKAVVLGRPEVLGRNSNQLGFRHTFASQKMRAKAAGQRVLWTPTLATSFGGEK